MEKIIATPKRMMWLVASCVMILAVVFGASATVLRASEDTTPPEMTAFSLSPTTFNTESDDVVLTLEVSLTDDFSGVCTSEDCGEGFANYTQLRLVPENGGDQYLDIWDLERTSGDELDGVYVGTATLPKGSMNGDWVVEQMYLGDQLGNEATMDLSEVAAIPGATGTTVTNQAASFDETGPVIAAFDLSPTTVNTESEGQLLTLEINVTDNQAGVCMVGECVDENQADSLTMTLTSPGGQQSLSFSYFDRTSGDDLDGVYEASATLPQGAESGVWSATIYAYDRLGNATELETAEIADIPGVSGATITNTASTSDTTAPEVSSFSITPTEFNTGDEDQVLTMEVSLTDDFAGVCVSSDCGDFYTSSPSQVRLLPLISSQLHDFVELELQSGDELDGTYTAELTMPTGSKVGIWRVEYLILADKLGNIREVTANQLSNLPGSEGVILVNTATADSVLIETDWTLTGDSGSVTFPEGTEVTKDDNGSFAFYQMVNQPYDVHALPDNNRAGAENIVGVLRTGIPDLNLEFSQPVTIALNVPSHLNGRLLVIQSMRENGTSWNDETTCLVAAGVCEFTVFHATHFLASTSSSTSDSAGSSSSVLPDSWPNTGFQWQFDATRFPF